MYLAGGSWLASSAVITILKNSDYISFKNESDLILSLKHEQKQPCSSWVTEELKVQMDFENFICFFFINLIAADFVQMSLQASLRLCMYFSCTSVTMKMEIPSKYEEKQNACL